MVDDVDGVALSPRAKRCDGVGVRARWPPLDEAPAAVAVATVGVVALTAPRSGSCGAVAMDDCVDGGEGLEARAGVAGVAGGVVGGVAGGVSVGTVGDFATGVESLVINSAASRTYPVRLSERI